MPFGNAKNLIVHRTVCIGVLPAYNVRFFFIIIISFFPSYYFYPI